MQCQHDLRIGVDEAHDFWYASYACARIDSEIFTFSISFLLFYTYTPLFSIHTTYILIHRCSDQPNSLKKTRLTDGLPPSDGLHPLPPLTCTFLQGILSSYSCRAPTQSKFPPPRLSLRAFASQPSQSGTLASSSVLTVFLIVDRSLPRPLLLLWVLGASYKQAVELSLHSALLSLSL